MMAVPLCFTWTINALCGGLLHTARVRPASAEDLIDCRPPIVYPSPPRGGAAMSFKSLLVLVDTLPGGNERLDLAVALARQHEAHLTAVHVVRPPEVPGAPNRVYFETILETALEQPERDVATLEEAFRERLRREGLLG